MGIRVILKTTRESHNKHVLRFVLWEDICIKHCSLLAEHKIGVNMCAAEIRNVR